MIDNLFPCDIGPLVTIQEATMKLRTIGLIGILALGLLAGPLPAEAQEAEKVYRIGQLSNSSRSGRSGREYQQRPNQKAYRQALRELGYVEGQNIV